jgi:hypothetical protein
MRPTAEEIFVGAEKLVAGRAQYVGLQKVFNGLSVTRGSGLRA